LANQDVREQSLDSAGSGRLSIWQHNIKTYVDFPIERKLLVRGLAKIVLI
jgi:hypothetical protein